MFHRGFFVFRFLGLILLIALLVGGGSWLYQSGQAQGYAQGLAAAGAAGKDLPVPPPYYGYGWMMPHFWPIGPFMGLFFIGLPLLFLFFMIGGFFRRAAWRHGPWAGGPQQGQPWGPPPWAGGPQQQPPAAAPQDPPVPGQSEK